MTKFHWRTIGADFCSTNEGAPIGKTIDAKALPLDAGAQCRRLPAHGAPEAVENPMTSERIFRSLA